MPVVKYSYVPLERVELFVRSAGDVNAPTVLLLHGFPSSSFQFRFMLRALSERWHLLAPDLPGFGFSKPRGHYSYAFNSVADTVTEKKKRARLSISATIFMITADMS